MTSFLQQHYNRAMDAGIDHAEYIVFNDISRELGEELRQAYKASKEAAAMETRQQATSGYRQRAFNPAMNLLDTTVRNARHKAFGYEDLTAELVQTLRSLADEIESGKPEDRRRVWPTV